MTAFTILCIFILSSHVFALDNNKSNEFSISLGWWNLETEWKSSFGFYTSIGVPWAAWLISPGSTDRLVPFGFRIGYQYDYSEKLNFRGSTHFAGEYGQERMKINNSETIMRTYQCWVAAKLYITRTRMRNCHCLNDQ